jgi:hypothetical protein
MAEQTQSQPINGNAAQTPPTEFTLSVIYRGFPVTITTYGKADALDTLITKLEAMGAGPAPVKEQAQASTSATPRASDGPPRCPVHDKPMKESRKPGSYYCSAKTRSGYCEETADV